MARSADVFDHLGDSGRIETGGSGRVAERGRIAFQDVLGGGARSKKTLLTAPNSLRGSLRNFKEHQEAL